ncbi:cell cycle checkpoint protein RAD17 [Asbolus verrucosus]|uniref:Cell cycle checkpoint protein RAD17 n=1 Tax=Asbolus verrucosus TaxID=1661398 RepID=A0A482WDJ4_ASBVE|nr:cell cycle checkpoint protein RAD17 [Asbolus verrucosus]
MQMRNVENKINILIPKTVSDLAVHPKKVKEVELWLQNNVINKPEDCWINPIDQNFEIHGGLNQVSRFSEFLMESKWNSLFSKNNKKVILIEEFPNALIRKPEDFAIILEYFKLVGTPDLPIVGDKLSMKAGIKRKRSGNTPSVKLMSRDENLGLFHALGRVLNPKFTEVNNCWRLNCDIEKIVDEFSIQPGIFTAFLFENYVKYFGDVNDACKAAEILSLSETFLDRWVDRHDTLIFALWLSVLGLMTFNKHKVSKWNQIKGPSKITKKINNDPATRNLSTTDLFYYNIINKNHKSQFIKSEI